MEDYYDIRLNFMELPIDWALIEEVFPPQLEAMLSTKSSSVASHGDADALTRSASCAELYTDGETGNGRIDAFHMFSLFDGHGGYKAAEHCSNMLAQNLKTTISRTLQKHNLPIKEIIRHQTVPTHVLLSEAINLTITSSSEEEGDMEKADTHTPTTILESNEFEKQRDNAYEGRGYLFSTMSIGIKDRLEMTDKQRSVVSLVSAKRLGATNLETRGLKTSQIISCLNDAFVLTENQFMTKGSTDDSGSTVLTALVSSRLLCFAHCGDCRAVLYRDGRSIQVTREHSPESSDERERIELLGGRILTLKRDAPRVMGVLNMTRAIGDFGLKPFIIPNPEVTLMRRCILDEFVVLASDGLWTTLDNEEVCALVAKCFSRVESRGMSRHLASKVAANILIRKAQDSGASDNISVVVIDLRSRH